MSKFLKLIAEAREHGDNIQKSINIIKTITYKNKPTPDDIKKLREVTVLLENRIGTNK